MRREACLRKTHHCYIHRATWDSLVVRDFSWAYARGSYRNRVTLQEKKIRHEICIEARIICECTQQSSKVGFIPLNTSRRHSLGIPWKIREPQGSGSPGNFYGRIQWLRNNLTSPWNSLNFELKLEAILLGQIVCSPYFSESANLPSPFLFSPLYPSFLFLSLSFSSSFANFSSLYKSLHT